MAGGASTRRNVENVINVAVVVGAAAGNVTVTGIKAADRLLSVREVDFTLAEGTPNTRTWAVADRTSQFSVTADNTINNTGGASTADKLLLVVWEVRPVSYTRPTTNTGRSRY